MITQSEGSIESLRKRQAAALKQVINFNQPLPNSLAFEPVWKLLIYDKYGGDIISPLIPVKHLRELGVTLHLSIDSKREMLPDVPAVYIIAPVEKNIKKICDDLQKGLYDNFYLNMLFPISRLKLEELANAAVDGGTVQQVQKVTDQYLSFITLEDDLFMLQKYSESSPISFFAINDPSTDDVKMDGLIDTIATGLFAVCVTLGVVPIIKCLRNNDAAEHVARKLDQKLRDNLRDARNNLFVQESIRTGQLNLHRPTLVIADRTIDISTMLHHTWTYQAMVADILDMDLNRIRLKDKNAKMKECEFAPDDKLWSNFKATPFPSVAEAIQEELDAYRKNEDEIKRLKNTMNPIDENLQNEPVNFSFDGATAKLSSAVGSLPELIEKKRLIDLHTNVATALLDSIKERKLDILYETEEKLLNGQEFAFTTLLQDLPNKDDALRLILIYACSRVVTNVERKQLLEFMAEKGIESDAFIYLQRLRSFAAFGTNQTELHSGAGTKTINMFSKLLNHSSRFVMEGVKNLVPRKHNLPLTKMVESLTEVKTNVAAGIMQTSSEADQYLAFDPKLMSASRDWKPTHSASDVIVFVVGGGNYVEYQNIIDYSKNRGGIQRITYGCTEMVNPLEFSKQLTNLGKRVK